MTAQFNQSYERTRTQKFRDFTKTFEFKTIAFATLYFTVAKFIADTEDLLIAPPQIFMQGIYALLAVSFLFLVWVNVVWSDESIRNAKRMLTTISFAARFFLPFFIGLFCMQAYLLVWTDERLLPLVKYINLSSDYTEAFYTSISTLYAIVTALALVRVLEKFDELKKNVEEEPHIIRQINDLLSYFRRYKSPFKGRYIENALISIKTCLEQYASNVAKLQDRDLQKGNAPVLSELRHAIAMLNPRDTNDEIALTKIIEHQAALSTLRIKRINALRDRIPGMLILMLWLVSGALILPFLSKPLYIENDVSVAALQSGNSTAATSCRPKKSVDLPPGATVAQPSCKKNPDRWGQYYMIVLMGTLYSFLLLMLQDISNPLDGFWQLNKRPFADLAHELRAELPEKST